MLGTFGDSFSDPNSVTGDTPWMDLLANKLNLPVEHHGRSGTSVWYSYEKFVKHYKKYSHIVFTYSYYDRINYLPEKFEGWHFKKPFDTLALSGSDKNSKKFNMELQKIADIYYKYLYNRDLQLFIYHKVYEDVHKLCMENGIEVIHNFVFEPEWKDNMSITLHDTRNVLSCSRISSEETHTYKPGSNHTGDIGVLDRRVCHMTRKNNVILADIMYDLFNSKEKTIRLEKSMFNFDFDELQRLFYKEDNHK